MKKKHIITSGKRLVKKKIKLIKEGKQPVFLFEGKLEDLKKSWREFVNGARREGKETTEAAKILAKIINKQTVTEEEKKFLKEQSKDLARIVAVMGLGAVSMALPVALEKVLNKWNINIRKSFMIGDQKSDRIAAQKSNLYYEDVGKNFFNQIKKIEKKINNY